MTDDLLGADQKIPDWLKIPFLERSTLQLNPGLLSWGQMTSPRACSFFFFFLTDSAGNWGTPSSLQKIPQNAEINRGLTFGVRAELQFHPRLSCRVSLDKLLNICLCFAIYRLGIITLALQRSL